MSERIAIVNGIRTPFCKANGVFDDLEADDLGAFVVREAIARSGLEAEQFDELIFGNVLQPPNATNIARVLAVKGGMPINVPAYTVNRNCASSMEAIVAAVRKIRAGDGQIYMVGGTESMSGFPIMFNKKMKNFFLKFSKARSFKEKMALLSTFRLSFLTPDVPKISDPLCSMTMGQTAEVLARDFKITRREQDIFGLNSQKRAYEATKDGRLADEIIPIPLPPKYEGMQEQDDGIRKDQTIEDFA
ncbi:MAG: thiolase family protein, partial [Chlamydiales bacterium]|nr:thiolase family protein [Chlamydiales bacterium]